jgi:hypothetical protein
MNARTRAEKPTPASHLALEKETAGLNLATSSNPHQCIML